MAKLLLFVLALVAAYVLFRLAPTTAREACLRFAAHHFPFVLIVLLLVMAAIAMSTNGVFPKFL